MNQTPRYATLRDYLRVIRDQRFLIILVTITFGAVALYISTRQSAEYSAEARLQVKDLSLDQALLGTQTFSLGTPEANAATTAALATTDAVGQAVKRRVRTRLSAKQLTSLVSANAEARTNFVVIEAKTSSPEVAATLANVFAQEVRSEATRQARAKYRAAAKAIDRTVVNPLTRKIKKTGEFDPTKVLDLSTAGERASRLRTLARFANPIDIVEPATPNSNPVSPVPVRDTFLGLLLGLIVALVAAFVRDSLDRRLRAANEIRQELKLPIIGHVRDELMGRTAVRSNGRQALSDHEFEAFRIMRTNLDFLDVDTPLKTVAVTSSLPAEGKSTVSTSLALSYATAGQRTLLVECDLRRPTMAARLGLAPAPGLNDYLAGNASPTDILQKVSFDEASAVGAAEQSLVCITAGTTSVRPAETLGSQRFKAFLAQVREAYDVVILDTAPLLSVVDTVELLPLVDGVLVCVRAAQTTRDQARAARNILEHFPAKPTGVVVTGMKPGTDDDYGYYSYAYAYGPRS